MAGILSKQRHLNEWRDNSVWRYTDELLRLGSGGIAKGTTEAHK